MKKENKIFYAAVLLFIIITALSCQKEQDFPSVFVNITATDCHYTKDGDVLYLTYTANHPQKVNYKRYNFSVYCKTSNVEEIIEHQFHPDNTFKYIKVDSAWLISAGAAYMQ